jgi:hypothetical protein
MLMVLALLAAICGGCGGSSSGSSGASGSGKDTILRIGTTYYIDSLDPLPAYEPHRTRSR